MSAGAVLMDGMEVKVSTHVVDVSDEELRARRAALLRGLRVTHDQLARRARDYALVGDEWGVWQEVQEIDFLLGDDEPGRR